MMTFLIILFVLIGIGCIIRYATEGTCSAYAMPEDSRPAPVLKPLSEKSLEEIQSELSQVEIDLEMQKIKYQGACSNPYVWSATRNMVKQNLENYISRRQEIIGEINRRNNNSRSNSDYIIQE